MRDSERYEAQALFVLGKADKALTAAERRVYLKIAEGWKQLAAEAAHLEQGSPAPEPRSFRKGED